jgi:hypothetical protein
MPKIIQILHHVHTKEVDFWHVFFDGWRSRYGKEVAKRTSDYQEECWVGQEEKMGSF